MQTVSTRWQINDWRVSTPPSQCKSVNSSLKRKLRQCWYWFFLLDFTCGLAGPLLFFTNFFLILDTTFFKRECPCVPAKILPLRSSSRRASLTLNQARSRGCGSPQAPWQWPPPVMGMTIRFKTSKSTLTAYSSPNYPFEKLSPRTKRQMRSISYILTPPKFHCKIVFSQIFHVIICFL